jgi:glycerol-3-phosphate acyltransferase PlsX
VVVTDGFVGNVVLKSLESLGSTIVSLIKQEAKSNPFNTLGFLIANQALRSLRKKMDYAEVGAAPLLGVAGYAWIAHGRSNAKAFKNALVKTQWTVKNRFLERFETAMSDVHS